MGGFLDAVLGFPAVLFSFGLVVVVGYWVVVLGGAADPEALDGAGADLDAGADAGDPADGDGLVVFLASAGLGGVPVTIVLSVLIALAWFLSLAGGVVVSAAPDRPALRAVLSTLVLLAAVVGAWLGTSALVAPLRRLMPGGPTVSRTDFVGRTCVVRTGRVGPAFGQAEVTASDGSSALLQVRLAREVFRTPGWAALVYDYDAESEVFRITPLHATHGSRLPAGPEGEL